MPAAVFDYDTWALLYPELARSVDEPRAQALFDQGALLYLRNDDSSRVTDVPTRLALLNLLVAHMAALGGAGSAGGYGSPTGLVGQVTQATEGSVSVSVNPVAVSGTGAWYAQTQYGLQLWAALAPYRTMRYVPGPRPSFEPYLNGRQWLR